MYVRNWLWYSTFINLTGFNFFATRRDFIFNYTTIIFRTFWYWLFILISRYIILSRIFWYKIRLYHLHDILIWIIYFVSWMIYSVERRGLNMALIKWWILFHQIFIVCLSIQTIIFNRRSYLFRTAISKSL